MRPQMQIQMNKTNPPLGRRPLFWVVLAAVALLVGGCAYFLQNQPSTQLPQTATVTRGDLKATVNANARVRSESAVQLAFPFAGRVASVNAQEGDAVEKDQVLAELDAPETRRRRQQAEMNLTARLQDLAEAQAPPNAQDLEIAQQSLKKAALALAAAEDRYDDDPTDDNRVAQELAQSDYEIARANFKRQTRGPTAGQVDDLERAIESARLELQAAQEALAQTRLYAPFAGTITGVSVEPGQLLGGYNPVVELSDLERLELLAEIDEIDVAEVREGQTVDLRFDAFPGKSATGKLTRLFPAASNDRGATVYQAVITLDPTELELRPGMGATANIATVERTGVLRVPLRAVKSAGSQKIVIVRDGNGTRNVVVETGLSDGTNTEIVSGVDEGTVVVIK